MSHWHKACEADDVETEDVIPVTVHGRKIAIFRSPSDEYFATDLLCTHEKVSLADGLVMGNEIECPKHNGRFDYRTGAGLCAPISLNLRSYPTRIHHGAIEIEITD
jgi:3-phenylpropionate/trans-cinnamate dioxygenase ferredoxin component